jgi:predicted nucleic acid-binding protein
LVELADSFADPHFGRRLSAEVIEAALDSLRIDGVVQPITVTVIGIAAHAEDNAVLVAALSANAPYPVTGDNPLCACRA